MCKIIPKSVPMILIKGADKETFEITGMAASVLLQINTEYEILLTLLEESLYYPYWKTALLAVFVSGNYASHSRYVLSSGNLISDTLFVPAALFDG